MPASWNNYSPSITDINEQVGKLQVAAEELGRAKEAMQHTKHSASEEKKREAREQKAYKETFVARRLITQFSAFIVLKLTDHIDWSWWWVLSPIWISLCLGIAVLLLIAILKAFDIL